MGMEKVERLVGLNEKEKIVIAEIGTDEFQSASKFAAYISEEYNIPVSTVWYTLKRLRDKGLLEFSDRESNLFIPLRLTKNGLRLYNELPSSVKRAVELGQLAYI